MCLSDAANLKLLMDLCFGTLHQLFTSDTVLRRSCCRVVLTIIWYGCGQSPSASVRLEMLAAGSEVGLVVVR
jgi:hypothetical protein